MFRIMDRRLISPFWMCENRLEFP